MKTVLDVLKLISFLVRCSRNIPRSRVTIVLIMVTGVIGGLSVTATITLINRALAQADSPMAAVAWAFAGLCVLSPVTRFASQTLLIRLTARAIFTLRMQLCHRIMFSPLLHQEELGAHRLLAALTEDIPTIINALAALPSLCVDVAILIGCMIHLGSLSWKLLPVVLGFLVVGILTYQLLTSKAYGHFKLAREEAEALFRHYRALTDGAKELKLHSRRREAFYSRLGAISDSLQKRNISGNTIYAAGANWGEVLYFIFIGLLLFAAPKVMPIEPYALTGYVFTAMFMKAPLADLLNMLPNMGRATISVQKIESLEISLQGRSPEQGADAQSDPKTDWKRLELSRITHAYHRDMGEKEFIFGPLNLTLSPAETVFLIGGNGSGKTTMAKLLTGLYAPESGEIRLDGEPVTTHNRDDYRQYFSAIFADFYIFDSLLGLGEAEIDSKARDYLAKLQLDGKVKINNGRFSTIDLSHGQRKRLALLTAYLEDRPIYLFDEWAADQDPLFKEFFYCHLLPELKAKNKTVIVISHDDRYYYLADRIIKLEYGKLELDERLKPAQASGRRRLDYFSKPSRQPMADKVCKNLAQPQVDGEDGLRQNLPQANDV